MHKSKDESIFDQVSCGVGKCCDNRKNVKRQNYKQSGYTKGYIKQRFSHGRCIRKETDVCNKYKRSNKKTNPYNQRLYKIILKSTEKGFYGSVIIALYCAERAVIEGSKCRSYCDDRNGTQDKQKIGKYNVADFV